MARAWRLYGGALAVTAAAHVAVLWIAPVLPGQDTPQHLGYVRILADHDDPELPFARSFELPRAFHPYFTTYYALVALARPTSPETALRILLSLYVLAMLAAFHFLVVTVHEVRRERDPPPWTALLGAPFVFGPLIAMGFIAFSLAAVVVLVGTAALLREADPACGRQWPWLSLVCAAALTALHPFALGCYFLVGVCMLFAGRRVVRSRIALVLAVAVASFALAWVLSEAGTGTLARRDVDDIRRGAELLDVVDGLFGITWHDPPGKLSYAIWMLLGPYPPGGLLRSAAVLGGAGVVLWLARRRLGRGEMTPRRRVFVRTTLVFLLAAAVAPWGLAAPDDLGFVDFRLIFFSVVLLVALVPPRLAGHGVAAPVALLLVGLVFAAQFLHATLRFGEDARPALALLDRVERGATLMPVVFHGRSRAFGKMYKETHFLPTYYTVRQGGICTQFWGRFTPHLPVAWREGAQPPSPPDWTPSWFRTAHLQHTDYVMIQLADPATDTRATRRESDTIRAVLDANAERVACDGLWCLYRARRQ